MSRHRESGAAAVDAAATIRFLLSAAYLEFCISRAVAAFPSVSAIPGIQIAAGASVFLALAVDTFLIIP